MKTRHFSPAEWHSDHPNANMLFQYCLTGDPDSRDNFMLVLGRQDGDFFMPRHRHNFDQIRLPLCGDMNIGEDLVLKEGQVGYFPEGLPYGPQNDALGKTPPGERLQLVLQFGGTSGYGFMSMDQRLKARDELAQVGKFIGPNYQHPGGKMEWGLNVIWRHVFKDRLKYPLPRYPNVVIADPARFHWMPVAGSPGVSRRFLGAFTERAAWVEMLRLRPGATWAAAPDAALRLVFVTTGAGQLGAETLGRYDALQLEPGETLALTAAEEMQLFVMGLPKVELPEGPEMAYDPSDKAVYEPA